ncbi:hypothetical protein GCM10009813_25460 [Brevibacterium marinum]
MTASDCELSVVGGVAAAELAHAHATSGAEATLRARVDNGIEPDSKRLSSPSRPPTTPSVRSGGVVSSDSTGGCEMQSELVPMPNQAGQAVEVRTWSFSASVEPGSEW